MPLAVGGADVVFGACAAEGWEFLVAVDVSLHLALTPPEVAHGGMQAHAEVAAQEPSAPVDLRQYGHVLANRSVVLTAPIAVEIERVVAVCFVYGDGDVVVDPDVLWRIVDYPDLRALSERHRNEAVHGPG